MDWPEQLIHSLRDIIDGNGNAEKICKTSLRKGQNSYSNNDRIRLSRCLYGVSSLRRRLEFLAKQIDGYSELERHKQLVCLVAIYIEFEESKYYAKCQSNALDQQWDPFARRMLGEIYQIAKSLTEPKSWPRDIIEQLGIQYSFPNWFVKIVIDSALLNISNEQDVVEEARMILHSFNCPGGTTLRCNTALISRENLITRLEQEEGIKCIPTVLSPHGLRVMGEKANIRNSLLHKKGFYEVQDEGSQLISLAASIETYQSVESSGHLIIVDYCCGRGGKSLHLLSLMINAIKAGIFKSGTLYCHDIDLEVLEHAKKRLSRANYVPEVVNIEFIWSQSTDSEDKIVYGGRGGDVGLAGGKRNGQTINAWCKNDLKILFGLADIVLVDAPCSSLGTMRRGPNVRWEIDPKVLNVFPHLQRNILAKAQSLVKAGGRLIYSTCTFSADECENIQDWFQSSFTNFTADGIDGLDLYANQELAVRLMPHTHNTDAFYITSWTNYTT
jgi:16S rRNA C967 or C1407 C5-methylase (RsmB/RsmF family)